MEKQVGIEYVCSGNGGRSPMAETLAKNYIKKLGLEERIKVYSSGTDAKLFEESIFNFPIQVLLDCINKGLKKEVFPNGLKQFAEYVLSKKDEITEEPKSLEKQMNKFLKCLYVERCINYLSTNETYNRDMALLEVGLAPEGPFHKQTKVRTDVNLILVMKQSNVKTVEQIYKNSEEGLLLIPKLKITTISEYAGLYGEIDDPFAGNLEDYKKTRDQLTQAVEKSIDKIIGEYVELTS